MGNLESYRRNLNEYNVHLAKRVEREKINLVKKMLVERVEKDSNFAKELQDALGDNLPEEVKIAVEKALNPKIEEQHPTGCELSDISLPPELEKHLNVESGCLPEDSLLTQNASSNNFPENQGLFNAFKPLNE